MGNPKKEISSNGRKLNYFATKRQNNFLRDSLPSKIPNPEKIKEGSSSPDFIQNTDYFAPSGSYFRRSPDYGQFAPTVGFSLAYFPEISWENFNVDKKSQKFEEFEKMWNTNENPKTDIKSKWQSTPKKRHQWKPYEANKEDKNEVDCEILAQQLIDIILQQARNEK